MEQYGNLRGFPINHIQPFFEMSDRTEGARGRRKGRLGRGHGDYDEDHGDGDHVISSSSSSSMSDGVVLSSDPKPRLRWTAQLHQRFVDAITQLGGADSKCLSSIPHMNSIL